MLARAARWLTSRLERLPTSERWAASTWAHAGERLAASMPFAEPVGEAKTCKGEKHGPPNLSGPVSVCVAFATSSSAGVCVCGAPLERSLV